MQFSCWKCRQVIEVTAAANRVGTRDTCTGCDADLHTCRNCRFYDPARHNQCAETQAEWVRDKEASNYCDCFSPNPLLLVHGRRPPSRADEAKKKFGSLFKT